MLKYSSYMRQEVFWGDYTPVEKVIEENGNLYSSDDKQTPLVVTTKGAHEGKNPDDGIYYDHEILPGIYFNVDITDPKYAYVRRRIVQWFSQKVANTKRITLGSGSFSEEMYADLFISRLNANLPDFKFLKTPNTEAKVLNINSDGTIMYAWTFDVIRSSKPLK